MTANTDIAAVALSKDQLCCWCLFVALAVAAAKGSNGQAEQRHFPRRPHRRKRPSEDRGLPTDEELAKLAMDYLNRQRKHWPELVAAGLLLEPTLGVITSMVEDFKERHRSGEVSLDAVTPFANLIRKLGGSYARYSCDNSSPNSIIDQTNKNLDKAASEHRFIPWAYVFADYSVSGLTASRVGYSSYKKVLTEPKHTIETTYIDDFTRASRDEIEWWRLAYYIRKLKKRLIGSSDGFDLDSPQGEMQITVYALVSRLFIKGLREKVRRGMSAAAERGTVLGKAKFWLTRRPRHDEQGHEVLGPDGVPVTEYCIDSEAARIAIDIVEMFVNKKMSVYKIVQNLNERKADNWDRWCDTAVTNILRSEALIGVFIWNRQRTEYDLENEHPVKVDNPRSEWARQYNKQLAIIPLDLYRQLRRRLAAVKRKNGAGKKQVSRNQVSASTLFSGTLICGYCGAELKLCRSSNPKKSLYCELGRNHAAGCKLSTSKSTLIIESALLGFLREQILTKQNVKQFVEQANKHLAELAAMPPVDLQPLKAEIRRLEQRISRLVRQMEDEADDRVRNDIHKRIKVLRNEASQKAKQLQELAPNHGRPIKPLDEATVLGYLEDLRGLLNQEIPVAAAALRMLTDLPPGMIPVLMS